MVKQAVHIFLFFLSINTIIAQSTYEVGIGSESIEPENSTFSLTLGGYAAPGDGRFTLTWDSVGKCPPLKAIAAQNGKLYSVSLDDELSEGSVSEKKVTWRTIGKGDKIVALTGGGENLYAVTADNALMMGSPGGNSISWTKKAKVGFTVALTAMNNVLYGVNDQRQLFIITNPKSTPSVNKVGDAGNVISMTSHDNMIYALRNDNTIWYLKPGSGLEWTKTARFNGSTYNADMKHLTVLNKRLFGIGADGQLYLARHSTRGDLFSKAIAVKANNKTAVIVAVDLVGLRDSLVNEIKEVIYSKRNIPPAAILINLSHTHFAPVTQPWPAWAPFNQKPDSLYLHNLVKKGIVKSIESALDNLHPASLYFGRGQTEIGHNRSSADLETPYDDDVDVIKVEYKKNDASDLLFLTGCHPVFPNDQLQGFTISANYPGVTRRLLEKKAKAGNALFIQGCGGDINPKNQDDRQTGMELALDVMSVLQSDLKKISGDISFVMDTVNVPVIPMSEQEVIEFKNRFINKEGDLWAEKNVRWADLMLDRYQKRIIPSSLPVYVQTINIGSWKLVGLSREVVTEYGLGIKKLWPTKMVSVAGYCNDVSSYLPAERHVVNQTYEGIDSFFWYAQPAVFPHDVLDIVLNQIRVRNR